MNYGILSQEEIREAEILNFGLTNIASLYKHFGNAFEAVRPMMNVIRKNEDRRTRKNFERLRIYIHALQAAIHESGHAVAFNVLCPEDRQRVDGIYLSRDLGASNEVGKGIAARVDNTPGEGWPINDAESWNDIYFTHAGIFFDRLFSSLFSSDLGQIELVGSNTRDASEIAKVAQSLGISTIEAESKASLKLEELNISDRVMYLAAIVFKKWQSGVLSTSRLEFLKHMSEYSPITD